ncbi:MAG TPA: hypothetical protein VMI33_24360 [Streptosporangiaceae bacterium]|nr:hypothetical protein [Streptosporangiaceae bacterium]
MRGMKVTVDAAMRARDVSRSHAEHEATARDNEPQADVTRGQPAAAPAPDAPAPAATPGTPAPVAAPAGQPKARRPHRRRRRR